MKKTKMIMLEIESEKLSGVFCVKENKLVPYFKKLKTNVKGFLKIKIWL